MSELFVIEMFAGCRCGWRWLVVSSSDGREHKKQRRVELFVLTYPYHIKEN
jgi:hypothetical protein